MYVHVYVHVPILLLIGDLIAGQPHIDVYIGAFSFLHHVFIDY